MLDKEELKLMESIERLEHIKAPEGIDDYILKGMAKGKQKKKRQANSIRLGLSAAVLCIALVSSIRISPAVAGALSKVPGLSYIVQLINHDKGLKDIVDNDFVQPINQSVQQEDLIFTIKDLIIDNSKAIFFYSIENKGDHKYISVHEFSIRDQQGERVKAFTSFWSFPEDLSVERTMENMVTSDFADDYEIPDKLYIEVILAEFESEQYSYEERTILPYSFEYEITVDKDLFANMTETYQINEEVVIEGQRFTFESLNITPTRMALKVNYDEDNNKQIFSFEDLELVDEKGEVWGRITNGGSASLIDKDNHILYFESNYFSKPKELYIKGSSIRALDKDATEVIIDIEQKSALKAPEGFKLIDVIKTEDTLSIEYSHPEQRENLIDIFYNDFKDSKGNIYSWSSGSYHNDSSRISFTFDANLQGPIYLEITDYPERITGEFKVKVK